MHVQKKLLIKIGQNCRFFIKNNIVIYKYKEYNIEI